MSFFYYSPTRMDPNIPPSPHFFTPPPIKVPINIAFPHEFRPIPAPFLTKPPAELLEFSRFPSPLDKSLYDSEISSEMRMTPLKKKAMDVSFPYRNKKKAVEAEGLGDVVYYFKEIIAFESEIEKCREELARKPDFRIAFTFNFFDANNSHQIIIPELLEGLTRLGIQAKNDDVYMLVKRYSRDHLEKLNLKEFERIFLPSSEANAKVIRQNDMLAMNFSLDKIMRTTRIYITKLLKVLLDYENALEFVRHKLKEKAVDLSKIFNYLDISQGNLLNSQEIRSIMSKEGYFLSEGEVHMILRRFDVNNSLQIGFNEFVAELTPRLKNFKKF